MRSDVFQLLCLNHSFRRRETTSSLNLQASALFSFFPFFSSYEDQCLFKSGLVFSSPFSHGQHLNASLDMWYVFFLVVNNQGCNLLNHMIVKKIQVLTAVVLETFTCLLLPFLFLFSFLHTFLMVPYEKACKHTVAIHFSFTSLTRLLMAFGCFRDDPSWLQQYQKQCQTVI